MILEHKILNAEQNIVYGVKIHDARKDKVQRWKPGATINHSVREFCILRSFMDSKVVTNQQLLVILMRVPKLYVKITIDRRRLSRQEVKQFAINNGHGNEEGLINDFFPELKTDMWAGTLIHWTKFKY